MTIDRITYTKTFATGPYLNEKIGVEIQLDAGEQPENALDMAKRTVEVWHKINNPHLDHSTKPMVQPDGSLPVISVEKEIDEGDLIMEKDKAALRGFEYKEEAAEYLSKSAYHQNVILKAIVNSKPNKP